MSLAECIIIALYCIAVQNSTRECEALEKQKIAHIQNLASQFTKLYEVNQLFEFFSVTVSGGKLFHNFTADRKKRSTMGSLLLIVVLYSVCDGLELLCVQGLAHCWESVATCSSG